MCQRPLYKEVDCNEIFVFDHSIIDPWSDDQKVFCIQFWMNIKFYLLFEAILCLFVCRNLSIIYFLQFGIKTMFQKLFGLNCWSCKKIQGDPTSKKEGRWDDKIIVFKTKIHCHVWSCRKIAIKQEWFYVEGSCNRSLLPLV